VTPITTSTAQVLQRITQAAQQAGRSANEICLVAVTKTHPLSTIIQGYQTGLRHFGENRITETSKVAEFDQWLATNNLAERPTWHFIGHIQTRQVGQLLKAGFDLYHGIDSLKLAQRFDRIAKRDNYSPVNILLQCNVSGETSKAGFDLSNWQNNPQQLTTFIKTVQQISALDQVNIQGLMTMAPFYERTEMARPLFKSLAQLRQTLQQELPNLNWKHLSMGMTNDFEVAIEEGATIVRVGRALFGERIQ